MTSRYGFKDNRQLLLSACSFQVRARNGAGYGTNNSILVAIPEAATSKHTESYFMHVQQFVILHSYNQCS